MKTDCIHYNDCRLPVVVCNDKCPRYNHVDHKWQDELLDIANLEYYEKNKEAQNDRP